MVTAQTATGQSVPAALLAWGRSDAGWMAGIAFLGGNGNHRAIITMWAASSSVRPVSHYDYSQVPQVQLVGHPELWPHLPPRYSNAEDDWTAAYLPAAR